MTNQELFKQAIADAKSVRDAAVANAKAALEETFTPSIMNMLSAKLNELEEDKEMEEEGMKVKEEGKEKEEGYGLEEADLDEILAQLEEDEVKMEEGKKEDKEEGKKDVKDALKEVDNDDEITELTVDELKDIIRDVLKDVMGAEEEEASEEAPEGEEGEVEVDDETEINLDELLAELEMEEGGYGMEGKKHNMKEKKHDMEEEHDMKGKKHNMEEVKEKEEDGKMKEVKKELEEAINTIQTLQSELNEVNLLNAKLLYTNKIFKAKSLNEAQKLSVLKAFDRAENVREVKTVYNVLAESFTSKTRQQQIKESVGFASKAVGVAPKQQIVEGDSAVLRMQQLAGIIK